MLRRDLSRPMNTLHSRRIFPVAVAAVAGLMASAPTQAQMTFSVAPGFAVADAIVASTDGTVLAGTSRFGVGALNTYYEAFRWTEETGKQYLGLVPGKISTNARDISGDGSIVVGEAETVRPGQPHVQEAFRWSEATGMQGLGYLPGGTQSEARAISTDGSTIVGNGDVPLGGASFRWTETGGMQAIGPGWAYGVSADGSFIVGEAYLGGERQGYLWSESGGMIGLGNLLQRPNGSAATHVVADGSLVAGYAYDQFDRAYAFLWSPEAGIRDFRDVLVNVYGIGDQVAGWSRLTITDLSDDGRFFTGLGISPNGRFEMWQLDRGLNPPDFPPGENPPPMAPIPEPATYGACAAVLLIGMAWRRRSRARVAPESASTRA